MTPSRDLVVYVGGSMEGISKEQMNGWRREFKTLVDAELRPVRFLDPCRRTPFHDQVMTPNLARRIVALDYRDIDCSDVVLLNFQGPGAARGTSCELAYASTKNKIIISVVEEGYEHPFINALSTEVHRTVADAAAAVREYIG